jgi:hypothetical protein
LAKLSKVSNQKPFKIGFHSKPVNRASTKGKIKKPASPEAGF